MIWLSNVDHIHNFNPQYIQTRYTNMVTKLKISAHKPISELEHHFYQACRERRVRPQRFDRRVAFAKMWHSTRERFYQVSELEIKMLSRKLAAIYVELKEIESHIRLAMETGQVHPENHDLNVVRYSVMGLEQVLGNYAAVSKTQLDPGMDMIALAESLSQDPLAEYLAREAEKHAALQDEEQQTTAHMSGQEESEDDELERMLMAAMETEEADEFCTEAVAQHRERAASASAPDLTADMDVLVDQLAGVGVDVSDEFTEAMGLLDRLSLQEKAEVLRHNADAVVKGME